MSFAEISKDKSIIDKASTFVDSAFDEALDKLTRLVKIPGIAWPSFDPGELQRSAQAVKSEFDQLGFFDFVEIRSAPKPDGTQGAPAVLARRAGSADAPHVLLYAHHDVQPPGDRGLWNSEPFEATRVGERLFGRGASDDKAGIITHIYALKALAEISENLRLGVTVFIE